MTYDLSQMFEDTVGASLRRKAKLGAAFRPILVVITEKEIINIAMPDGLTEKMSVMLPKLAIPHDPIALILVDDSYAGRIANGMFMFGKHQKPGMWPAIQILLAAPDGLRKAVVLMYNEDAGVDHLIQWRERHDVMPKDPSQHLQGPIVDLLASVFVVPV